MKIPGSRRARLRALTGMAGAGLLATMGALYPLASASASSSAGSSATKGLTISPTGVAPGAIKHVWLIILENKSYDATFTGLNQNSYLWQTLPSAGRAADQLLRHRPLQHGQLHLAGVGPVPVRRHPGRLLHAPNNTASTPNVRHRRRRH